MNDDRPTLSYRPTPPSDPPVDAGPIGCALAAMMTFAVVCLALLLALLLPTLSDRRAQLPTLLVTAVLTFGGLGWIGVRLGRDPRSRSFAHGVWIGALAAATIVAVLILEGSR